MSVPERHASEPLNGRVWHKLVHGSHESWRQPVLEILRYYTERTPGSMIDDRGISIVWRYANTVETSGEDSRRNSSESKEDEEAHSENLAEVPTYKDGHGNEAYHWARRQAAEVQNHIMVSSPPMRKSSRLLIPNAVRSCLARTRLANASESNCIPVLRLS